MIAICQGTEVRSLRQRQCAVLLGYNLPWLLWADYAWLKPLMLPESGLWCPTCALLHWCPSCGMTTEFTALLVHGQLPSVVTLGVLLGFLGLAVWSVWRCRTLCP